MQHEHPFKVALKPRYHPLRNLTTRLRVYSVTQTDLNTLVVEVDSMVVPPLNREPSRIRIVCQRDD